MNERQRRRVLTTVTALTAALLVTSGGGTAQAAASWQDTAGPAIASAPPPRTPQLENTGIWRAKPTQVCMSSAYRAGEFLYQGCVWDDQGGGVPQEWPLHTMLKAYTYPTDPAYRANAADLVELRTRAVTGATAFRLTYNTMTDPELVATTIALGTSAAAVAMPYGANTVTPAQVFATVHGTTADFTNAAGTVLGTAPATVDRQRRQVEVRVPHTVFTPTGAVRVAAATGLWDRAGNRYLVPKLVADATHPGGALATDPTPSAFFDVAFRFDEPLDSAWRDRQQKIALAKGDISQFSATVDFTKLAAGINDDMTGRRGGVPKTGYVHRIYATHFELAQGRRLPSDPGGPPPGASTQQNGLNLDFDPNAPERPSLQFGWVCRDDCVPGLAGQLQRYLAYVPALPAPSGGYGSLTWTPGYAQTPADFVGGKDLYTSVANRAGAPTVVVVVDGRGNDNWFYGQSGASVFEAIADASRNWPLDPNRRVLGGFSSGAYGANKLSLTFPDYFSKAFPCDGLNMAPSFPGVNGIADTLPVDTLTQHEPGSELTPLLPSRRNQPVMEWAGLPDDFIPYVIPRERADAYVAGDYDFAFGTWTIASGSHLVLCDNGTWDVLTTWLGTGERVRNPAHVTYVRNPMMDDPAFGMVGDHAYWLSGIETRGGLGTVDVFSHGFGVADPAVPGVATQLGVATGTVVPLNAYTMESRALPAPAAAPVANRLDITATNIGSVTIDPAQAKVDCGATLDVTTDGPVRVTLLGCGTRTFGQE